MGKNKLKVSKQQFDSFNVYSLYFLQIFNI